MLLLSLAGTRKYKTLTKVLDCVLTGSNLVTNYLDILTYIPEDPFKYKIKNPEIPPPCVE